MNIRILACIIMAWTLQAQEYPHLSKVLNCGHKELNTLIDTTRTLMGQANQAELIRHRDTYAALKYTLETFESSATPELEKSILLTIGYLFDASLDPNGTPAEYAKAIISAIQQFRISHQQELAPHLMVRQKVVIAARALTLGICAAGATYGLYTLYRNEPSEIAKNLYSTFHQKALTPLYNLVNYLTHIHDIKEAENSYAAHLRRYITDNHANNWHYFQPSALRNLSADALNNRIEEIIARDLEGQARFMHEQIAVQGNNWLRNIAIGSFGSTMLVFAHKNYLNFLKMENTLKLIFATTTASLLSVFAYYSLQSAKTLYGSYYHRTKISIKVIAHELFMLYNQLLEAEEIFDWQRGIDRYYRETLEKLAHGLAAHERALLLADCKTLSNPERTLREKIRLIKHWHSSFNLSAV